jgi:SpoVK/Ycf46/Vps4 family AAA+-type ATPase
MAKSRKVDPRTRKPTPESLRQIGHTEGKAVQLAANDATVRELLADAAALERSSEILANARLLSGFGGQDMQWVMRAMAAGIRTAADRVPSTGVPF